MVQVYRINDVKESDIYETDFPVIGKILKVFVDLGDCPLATVKILTTEGEEVMNREFRQDQPGVYKPLDVIVEGSSYQHFYSTGKLIFEVDGSVSDDRPLKEVRIFYE